MITKPYIKRDIAGLFVGIGRLDSFVQWHKSRSDKAPSAQTQLGVKRGNAVLSALRVAGKIAKIKLPGVGGSTTLSSGFLLRSSSSSSASTRSQRDKGKEGKKDGV
jgi:hypothetical protein